MKSLVILSKICLFSYLPQILKIISLSSSTHKSKQDILYSVLSTQIPNLNPILTYQQTMKQISNILKILKQRATKIPNFLLDIPKGNNLMIKLKQSASKSKLKLPILFYLFQLINRDYSYLLGGILYYNINSILQCPTINRLLKVSQSISFLQIYITKLMMKQSLFVDVNKFMGGQQPAIVSIKRKQQGLVIQRLYKNLYQLCTQNSHFHNGYFCHFNTQFCQSDIVTQGIRIRAHAIYSPFDHRNQPDSGQFLFVYQIRISDAGVDRKWKLTTRYWKIQQVIVQGQGVIGLYPQIQAGCEDFMYCSCTLAKPGTKMGGYFTFIDLEGNTVKAVVKQFCLNLPQQYLVKQIPNENLNISIMNY